MHVEIHSGSAVWIGIVTFGSEDEDAGELRVTIQSTDALNHITVEYFVRFPTNDYLPAHEAGTTGGEIFVDDLVKFTRALEREPKK